MKDLEFVIEGIVNSEMEELLYRANQPKMDNLYKNTEIKTYPWFNGKKWKVGSERMGISLRFTVGNLLTKFGDKFRGNRPLEGDSQNGSVNGL